MRTAKRVQLRAERLRPCYVCAGGNASYCRSLCALALSRGAPHSSGPREPRSNTPAALAGQASGCATELRLTASDRCAIGHYGKACCRDCYSLQPQRNRFEPPPSWLTARMTIVRQGPIDPHLPNPGGFASFGYIDRGVSDRSRLRRLPCARRAMRPQRATVDRQCAMGLIPAGRLRQGHSPRRLAERRAWLPGAS
jgi:hypothetical protein